MLQFVKNILSKRQVRFLIVGGLLFVIDYVTSVVLFYTLPIPAGIASAAGFVVSFFFGFTLNRNVVFAHSTQSRFTLRTQVTLYLLLALFNLLLSSSAVQVVDIMGVNIELSKPIITIIIAIWNYIILGRYIFQTTNVV